MSAHPARFLGLVALLAGAPAVAHAQAGTPLPDGVTPAMVAAGNKIFHGPGMCQVCHGPDGKGGIGANLTDSTWLHSKGSYQDIVHQVMTGVSQKESTKGIMMPPRGGSSISDDQVKEVAAYVWTLSHPQAK